MREKRQEKIAKTGKKMPREIIGCLSSLFFLPDVEEASSYLSKDDEEDEKQR